MPYRAMKSFKVRDYKCFLSSNDYQGFDEIKPINVIIGKNNSGKSKILEFLHEHIQKERGQDLLKANPRILFRKALNERELKEVFVPGATRHEIGDLSNDPYDNHWLTGQRLLGKSIQITHDGSSLIDHNLNLTRPNSQQALIKCTARLSARLDNPFKNYESLRIRAERDIKPEGWSNQQTAFVEPDGRDLTQIMVRCLQDNRGDRLRWREFLQDEFVKKINSVLSPDIEFTGIHAKFDVNTNNWEIYLEEKGKGGIKLSDCGSGIKTVIFVMAILYLVPQFRQTDHFVFMLEELENNLHPSLERRLLAHVRDYILKAPKNVLFLTTHSNIAVDMFSNIEEAQILRAYNDGKASFIEKVSNWNDHHNLMNELGVRASDVLQTNCVIWLEGPSDRVYFNKWIELFDKEGEIEENVHYQCVYYGGSILSDFSADPEHEEEMIKMLKINRNAVILMDSDKSDSKGLLKARVQRIVEEAKKSPSVFAWVTAGREIENYIPDKIIKNELGDEVTLKAFERIGNKFKTAKKVETFGKVNFATKVTNSQLYTKTNLETHLDLKEKMEAVISHIKNCNFK